ncbi:hypothetical protein C1645_829348 [Glomus cerebriforme]|uniref:TLD-domain-containing protein n=1 Tax=Glomus cerebriforme TaxID=658196 RepID=A0A397SP49_9GLOM|nr:hypothetical protein C1645_829348 [Glomus cerebriforme]
MSHKFVPKALGNPLKNEVNHDVIIYIGKKSDFKEFYTDSKSLCKKSDHFKKILFDKDIEKKDGKYVIKKPNITPKGFEVIIKYLSNEDVNLIDNTGTEILNIIIASDDFKLNQLMKLTEEFFMKNLQQFYKDDPVEILQMIFNHKNLSDLQKVYLGIIRSDPEILFNSVKFINLPSFLLEIILKQDILNVDEIKVWENLIKWGLAQKKTLDEDVSKWNQEEFNILKEILCIFIPLIRFYDISSEDYFIKVRPYEKILSEELQIEILKFHMISGYKPTLNILRCQKYHNDSVLINRSHTVIFTNWIDRKENSINSYHFKLLYRASRDGNTAAAFHEKCDNKGATIVIAKITNSEQIIGGYNPLQWDSSYTNKSTRDSFIFSFTNKNNLQTAKVSYSNGDLYSIGCLKDFGPLFGGGRDLMRQSNGTWCSNPYSYPTLNLPSTDFNVEDYEVYQVY